MEKYQPILSEDEMAIIRRALLNQEVKLEETGNLAEAQEVNDLYNKFANEVAV